MLKGVSNRFPDYSFLKGLSCKQGSFAIRLSSDPDSKLGLGLIVGSEARVHIKKIIVQIIFLPINNSPFFFWEV